MITCAIISGETTNGFTSFCIFASKIDLVISLQQKIEQSLRNTVAAEYEAVRGLMDFIDNEMVEAVRFLYSIKGRIVVSGIGKSAIVAQKMVASLNSTGSPALFLHAADAIHGDLGMVQEGDVVIIISNSGNTPEIKILSTLIKANEHTLIAICGERESFLAKKSDFFISSKVEKEACPNNLAPTSSTTAQMVVGDAIMVALLELRGFSAADFAKFHPGGLLGKKMYLRVKDLYTSNAKPEVLTSAALKDVILEISSARLGSTAVLDEKGHLMGIITDGDLRRMLEKEQNPMSLKAEDIMSTYPKTISPETLVIDALQQMKTNKITQLIVSDREKYLGIIHLHDIIKEGFV